MPIDEFADFMKFPTETKSDLNELFKEFFRSPVFLATMQAIITQADKSEKVLLGELQDKLIKAFSTYDHEQYWALMAEKLMVKYEIDEVIKQVDKELTENFHLLIDRFVKTILDFGNQYLTRQGKKLIQAAIPQEGIVNFVDFCSPLFEDGRLRKVTIQHAHAYLTYLTFYQNKYLHFSEGTESQRQVELLQENISITLKLISTYLKELIKSLFELAESYRKARFYRFKQTLSGITDQNKLELELIELMRADQRKYFQVMLERYFTEEGSIKTGILFSSLEINLAYWEKELPRIKLRKEDIKLLEAFAEIPRAKGERFDLLYRFVSEDEKRNIKDCKALRQGPSSTEREKWFFLENAAPGAHVSHEYLCVIYLRAGALSLLRSLQRQDGQYAAFVSKEAEPNCLGIHEDALSVLNRLVIYVEIKPNRATLQVPVVKVDFTISAVKSEDIVIMASKSSEEEAILETEAVCSIYESQLTGFFASKADKAERRSNVVISRSSANETRVPKI
ncbi:MAG: hypothetical protein A3E87_00510 [Gammaproteobacteria bacterium RIFCSPHIGHO2_12_FULL_35_23]|nr:MAG: hypothetical protein A3E87_00510 [Gammaproteobacteria bacterium RIFCSPHIGHO2_12_FULL_35_23]